MKVAGGEAVCCPRREPIPTPPCSPSVMDRYDERMTAEELAARLLRLPPTAEVLAFEPGCEQYLEREIDDIEWRGRFQARDGRWYTVDACDGHSGPLHDPRRIRPHQDPG